MKTPRKGSTMPPRLNTSMMRRPKLHAKRWIKRLVPYLILSGLSAAFALSVCLLVLPTIVEEQGTKEVPTTNQTPNNVPAATESSPTTSVQPTQETPAYTYDELYCMAVVIYNEAGGNECTDEARELVGYVVLNRVNDSRYPDTIRGVLEQPGQYAGLGSAGVHFAERTWNEQEAAAMNRAWRTARKVLENRDTIPVPDTVVFQAEFTQGVSIYKQIGNMYFCHAEEAK